jgi:methyltransferase-like protein
VWFRDFAGHALRHGLQYLGEADSPKTFDPAMMEVAAADVIEREQYLDFFKLRRFRRTLLCRQEVALSRAIGGDRMDEFLFSENEGAERVPGEDQALEAVAQALHDTAPLPARFEELIPYAGNAEVLRQMLLALLSAGAVNLHVHDFPCQETVTERPRASRLARLQATTGDNVTSACHSPVKLDAIAQQLVQLLDGTRTHEEIARELAALEGAPRFEEISRHLPGSLDWLARMALLEE